MARTSTLPIHDRALGGRLIPLLREWRDQGLPLQVMTFRLHAEHEIFVSVSTVGRWVRDLDEDPESESKAANA